MHPTGCFDRFESDILCRYDDYEENDFVTFGILIADPRQSEAREYIVNYLEVFNNESKNYFDFFIPGYSEFSWPADAKKLNINIDEKEYYFSDELFYDFLTNLEKNFHIEYTFNPMLILMTMRPGQKNTAQYIVIELDNADRHGIRRSGMLFRKIFRVAKSNPQLDELQNMFQKTYIKGNWLNSIVNSLGPNWLIEINKTHSELRRYRIRGHY